MDQIGADEQSARAGRGPYAGTDQRRDQIVRAAFDVFRSSGFQGGTMREIAARVGVSHSSLKHHFGSKEDLLVEVLRRRSAVDLPVIRAFAAEGGILYAAIAMAHYNSARRGIVQLHTLLVAEAADADHPARLYEQERQRSLVAEMEDGLRALKGEGELAPGVDPLMERHNIPALSDGLQVQWLLDDRVDMAAQTCSYVDRLAVRPVRRPTPTEIHDIAADPTRRTSGAALLHG